MALYISVMFFSLSELSVFEYLKKQILSFIELNSM